VIVAKKRTLRPFYGKAEQRMEQLARREMQAGRHDNANSLYTAALAKQRIKMFSNLNMRAQRPFGRHERLTPREAHFIKRYS
jgi:hypothetical protein